MKNTGKRAGAEVVQLYVHDGHAKIDRPAHELKAFNRVELKPGETQTVEFKLDNSAFEYWSPETKRGPSIRAPSKSRSAASVSAGVPYAASEGKIR